MSSSRLTYLQHGTQDITPSVQTHVSLAPALSGSPVTSLATPCQHPLLGSLRHVGLYSLECSRTQSSPLLSSVSSDSTPLKYQRMLTAYRLTTQARSSPLESRCTPPATHSASPIRALMGGLNFYPKLSCHLPTPQQFCLSNCSDQNPGVIPDSCFPYTLYPILHKFCWLYLQNISKIQSLTAACTGSGLVSLSPHHPVSGLLQQSPLTGLHTPAPF